MSVYAEPLERLIGELSKLPGIGPKSAQRISFYILSLPKPEAIALARAIVELKERIKFCKECYNISESDLCSICADSRRDSSTICVVEEPRDIVAIERSGTYRGKYHVLGGAISPIDGIGPEQLRLEELRRRVEKGGISEVIVATNPNAQGDATALYITQILKPFGVKLSRIASGLPVGGEIEYADEVTIGRAMGGRMPL